MAMLRLSGPRPMGIAMGPEMWRINTRPIRISYDGLYAAEGYMDASNLGPSLLGMGRILRVSAYFGAYKKYSKRPSDVRVLLRPPQDGSYCIEATIATIAVGPWVVRLADKVVRDITVELIKAILFKRSGDSDMNEHIMERLLDLVTAQNEQAFQSHARSEKVLHNIITKLIDNNQRSAKQAVSPVGVSCDCMSVGGEDEDSMTEINEVVAAAIRSEEDLQIDEEATYLIRLDGVTLTNKTCSLTVFEGNDSRTFKGRIVDPILMQPNNPYTNALDSRRTFQVHAKEARAGNKPPVLYITKVVE